MGKGANIALNANHEHLGLYLNPTLTYLITVYAVTGICRYWESDSVQSYRNPTDCMKFERVLRVTEGVESMKEF